MSKTLRYIIMFTIKSALREHSRNNRYDTDRLLFYTAHPDSLYNLILRSDRRIYTNHLQIAKHDHSHDYIFNIENEE
uniref:Uncharacterized protein n=1 Tax=Heterorhabditis bacteriophora TaxID=37862 RepID=A0A1I7WAA5_HETBA